MYDVNLYPPIFSQSYMPAFKISEKCKVYFQISPLNTLDDLYHINANDITNYGGVQVAVRKQRNNESALKNNYQNEIMLANLQIDATRKGNDKYFIEINNSDIQGGFNLNEYYKVQIRFTSSQVSGTLPDATTSAFRSWLTENLNYFSEWSSIALIRGISNPDLELTVNGISTNTISISSDYVQIRGSVEFHGDSEKLQKYRVLLYNGDFPFVSDPEEEGGEISNVEEDSGDIYAENGIIKYDISTALLENTSYKLRIIFTTNNLYQWSSEDKTITLRGITPMSANIQLEEEVNNNIGCIKLILKRSEAYINKDANKAQIQQYYTFIIEQDNNLSLSSSYLISNQAQEKVEYDSMGYDENTVKFDNYWQRMMYYDEFNKEFLSNGDKIIIRRSSSVNNFKTWKFLTEFKIKEDDVAELYWQDYTAEPGIWYRYQVIRQDSTSTKTAELVTDINKPVMLDTDDIFLNSNGEQLILKFDPAISGFSNKIAESITDTIGSKYPFIRRNGNVNYRTFSLSGTISCFMDVQSNVFHGSEEDLYGASAKFYKQYNDEKNVNLYNDFIYERHFRQKVINFLQSSSIKLLRSVTEGNILVKLGNISFTPNQTLGRRIYSFSCTAYEIADCNEENYIKYKIIKDNLKIFTKEDVEDNGL